MTASGLGVDSEANSQEEYMNIEYMIFEVHHSRFLELLGFYQQLEELMDLPKEVIS